MTDPLQQFDWKSSSYERPGDVWVCGKACDGMPCRLGPGADGECSVRSQCEPEKVGDRYRCTRSVLHGGKCSDGPGADGTCCQADESCQPRMTLLKRRRVAGAVCAAISLACCLVAFSQSGPQNSLSPGAIAAAHAGLETNCAACHVAAEPGTNLLSTAVGSHHSTADSEKCLTCHQNIGAAPFSPHSLDQQVMADLTAGAHENPDSAGGSAQLAAFVGSVSADKELSCSVCHQEHHGRSFNLSKLSDQQCQTCHKSQFADFTHGHPEFEHFPHETRPKIYFDHARHLNAYFQAHDATPLNPAAESPTSCSTCHQPDAAGGMMLTADFDRTCASCHESQIVDLPFPGVPFFGLPQYTQQTETESDEDSNHGNWPVTESSLRKMPPYMSLLFADADSGASPGGISSAIIWRCKQLLLQVRRDGETALAARLPKQYSQLADSFAGMSPMLVAASRSWFPRLSEELAAHNANQPLPETASVPLPENRAIPPGRGWYISDIDRTIRYRPVSHADPVLRRLLDNLVPLVQGKAAAHELQELYAALANPSGSGEINRSGPLATGRCLSCHTTSTDGDGVLQVNWNTKKPVGAALFTKFRHESHTQNNNTESCLTCHQIQKEQQTLDFYRPEYFTRDDLGRWIPQTDEACPLSSGLSPIQRSQCVSCHNKSTVSQTCLECHNYHVHSP
jgi:hypothetical protein